MGEGTVYMINNSTLIRLLLGARAAVNFTKSALTAGFLTLVITSEPARADGEKIQFAAECGFAV